MLEKAFSHKPTIIPRLTGASVSHGLVKILSVDADDVMALEQVGVKTSSPHIPPTAVKDADTVDIWLACAISKKVFKVGIATHAIRIKSCDHIVHDLSVTDEIDEHERLLFLVLLCILLLIGPQALHTRHIVLIIHDH